MPADSLSADALLCQFNLDAAGAKCWAAGVRKTLEECGFAYVWHSPLSSTFNSPQIISSFHQRLKDIYLQSFISEMRNNNKLRTYRLLKNTYHEEKYLKIPNIQHRTAITKLRISSHKLHIEKGRHNHIPLQERICQYCELDEIEDEYHFVANCTLYRTERESLYAYVKDKFHSFGFLDEREKFTL